MLTYGSADVMSMLRWPGSGRRGVPGVVGAHGSVGLLAGRREGGVEDGGVGGRGWEETEVDAAGREDEDEDEAADDAVEVAAELSEAEEEEAMAAAVAVTAGPTMCCVSLPQVYAVWPMGIGGRHATSRCFEDAGGAADILFNRARQ